MNVEWIVVVSGILALIPATLFLRNLALYRRLPGAGECCPHCSVLIPARDEESNIEAAVRSVLASEGIHLEVVVLDDNSTDRTAEIVRRLAEEDARVRLETAGSLPPGWCGKPFACQRLSALARYPLLVFIDADVRVLRTDALARLAQFLEVGPASLASGVPYEETGTFLEKLVVPLIHFVLLGFLPLRRMRASTDPKFAAACGQIIAVRRDDYVLVGGHATIPDRLHDGVALARRFREEGFATDLFDATDTFGCRMYHSASDVWNGFAKNAQEALASPKLIGPATLLLFGGQILPFVLLVLHPSPIVCGLALVVVLPRLAGVWRFRQSIFGALLHPIGVAVLLTIQWFVFFRTLRCRPAAWKGREYFAVPER